jgi:hypothetical protein
MGMNSIRPIHMEVSVVHRFIAFARTALTIALVVLALVGLALAAGADWIGPP